MSLEEFLEWRKGAGDAPLTRQLQAAIAATGQSLYAVAQASGVAAPVLQRFINGERGITLETAGKLAAYLGLSLMPESRP
ncbi:MAG TPA: helix-turn-helix domain-containing protein [Pirellulaceae bacterium]|nr:helix-turn-helix domain-containing protein [Pirellulaceae bacterium]